MEAVTTIYQILKDIWPCLCECVSYKNILEANMKTLKGKMEELGSREGDIHTELENAKNSTGMKQKNEVECWLKNVQDKKSEVQKMEQKAGKRRYFMRLQFLRHVEKIIKEVDELIERGKFSEGLFINIGQDQERVLVTTPLVGTSMKDMILKKIWEYLMNDEIRSIGVYGMGGAGKTTIVTHIHNQLFETIKSTSTFHHVYWVTVSQESTIHKLQDKIAKVLQLDLSDEQDENRRAAKLFEGLTARKKFVLILDDMWDEYPLEKVGIPLGVNSGKLIVTSRSLEVCRRMNCKPNIIKVEPLSKEEAWELFMDKLERKTLLALEVEEMAKSIVEECAGLPLAIITTAGCMRGVDDIHEWRNALNEMKEPTNGMIDMENKVFKVLKFSYDRLNDEKLQQCLLYCALFPEDYKIEREHLIMRWIAEGLIDEMKTRQAEFDKGHVLLNKLENVCMLERTTVFYYNEPRKCVKMHDVIRDMALSMSRVSSKFMVKAGVRLSELPDEREWSDNVERVSLMENEIKGQLSCISPNCPRLCTLMLQSNHSLVEVPNSLFTHMLNLRVLDLSETKVERLPDSISHLKELRALLLHKCEELRYVPSLANLTEMRELDLYGTAIVEIPHGMEKLVNLKRLDLPYGRNRDTCPRGVLHSHSRLQSLALGRFEITDAEHVEEIITLEVLIVRFYNSRVFNNYVKTRHWENLSLYNLNVRREGYERNTFGCFRRGVELLECNLVRGGEDSIVLPTNIQQLIVECCNDMSSLSCISASREIARKLERCFISCCKSIEHLWSWSIPSRKEEESEWCTKTNTNTNTALFQSLRLLELNELPKFSALFNFKGAGFGGAAPESGTFSNLKYLTIAKCPNLKYVFKQGLVQHHLQNLEKIKVFQCPKMENIILAEEEEEEKEKQEEIVAAAEVEVRGTNSIITCPKLRNLELRWLPNLKSIWKGTVVCHSLQKIKVGECPMLRRLPLSLHPQTSSSTLESIQGAQEWWDLLEWDAKSDFQHLFKAAINPPSSLRARKFLRSV